LEIVRTYALKGLVLLKPRVFPDERGYFMETYNRRRFAALGIDCEFVQDNQSSSCQGTLRGLHYQVNLPQDKLVRALQGRIFDVAVDIRPDSATRGQWIGEILSEENQHQLFVPRGFAHGFQVLSPQALLAYKCSNFYSPQDERGLLWSDPDLAIDWPDRLQPLLSPRDRNNPTLAEASPGSQGEVLA